MKLQWKLVIGLLMGMLVIGQIVAIRYAVARDQDMQSAQSEARDAVKFSDAAQATWNSMHNEMKMMMTMPNGPEKEKAIGKMMQSQDEFNQNVLTSNVHSLNAIKHIWVHVDKQQ